MRRLGEPGAFRRRSAVRRVAIPMWIVALAAVACDLPTEPDLTVGTVTLGAVGDSAVLEVRGEPRDGIVWRSLTPAVVAVTPAGVARAVAPGVGVVQAQLGSRRAEGTVTVLPAVDVRVSEVTGFPATAGRHGVSMRLRNLGGRGFYRLELWRRDPGGEVRRVMAWTSDAEAAPGMDVEHRAELTGDMADWVVVYSREPLGTAPTRTSCGVREGAAECPTELPPDIVADVRVEPGAALIEVGQIRQYRARAYDASGRELEGRAVVWFTPSPDVISLSPDGRVQGLRPGYGEVRATVGGVTGAVGLTVTRSSSSSSSNVPSGGSQP